MEETEGTFSDVLMDSHNTQTRETSRRILHFSDGILEECNADEVCVAESDGKTLDTVAAVDPSTMSWGPWLWHKAVSAGSTTLRACDYVGETLADFFGITTPKYQLEIDEYKRMVREEEEEKKRQDLEMGGWSGSGSKDILEKSGDVQMASLPLKGGDSGKGTATQSSVAGSEDPEKY
ncbi:protein FAM177A1 [Schistocerca nitens]|uniref:protein FAM177A1 n=1 Tax=Schistocerca nitens TaxID=7011 RepID=UPI0021179477|nr:protein FAM177A1 [Schistocerca nitens]